MEHVLNNLDLLHNNDNRFDDVCADARNAVLSHIPRNTPAFSAPNIALEQLEEGEIIIRLKAGAIKGVNQEMAIKLMPHELGLGYAKTAKMRASTLEELAQDNNFRRSLENLIKHKDSIFTSRSILGEDMLVSQEALHCIKHTNDRKFGL